MSKYLESVCLWEQNEKYLFLFEGFYVKFACKKRQPQWQRGLVMRTVCTAVGGGCPQPCGLCTHPEVEGTNKLRLE